MYEEYYGFTERPFSLTPDPKFLYRSESHANAFDLLQYAISRREGFTVITGDIGTGKTTLCRALLEHVDRKTFTALVLNPFLTEEELLKQILQDFGVMSRFDLRSGRLASVSKQELIDTLYQFLLTLVPLRASAVVVIDEAQNLPVAVLEQIRILSNLETDKEKLLQIVLVGQLNLQTILRSPEMRQLDQRVSIRYQLEPLDLETVGAYIAHRLTVAGGSAAVAFSPKAVVGVHQFSGGVPRLINLICDRSLLAAFSARANRVNPEMVERAAESLDLPRSAPRRSLQAMRRHGSLLAGIGVVLVAIAVGMGSTAYLYRRFAVQAESVETPAARAVAPTAVARGPAGRALPPGTDLTILVGSYPKAADSTPDAVRALRDWLEGLGFTVFSADVDLGSSGTWQRIFAGSYRDMDVARRDLERLVRVTPGLDAHVVDARTAVEGVPAPETSVSAEPGAR